MQIVADPQAVPKFQLPAPVHKAGTPPGKHAWLPDLHGPQLPDPLQNPSPASPQRTVTSLGRCSGDVPTQVASVHSFPSSGGRSSVAATSMRRPSEHSTRRQSPGVWSERGPSATGSVAHFPPVQTALRHGLPGASHSRGLVQARASGEGVTGAESTMREASCSRSDASSIPARSWQPPSACPIATLTSETVATANRWRVKTCLLTRTQSVQHSAACSRACWATT